MGRKTVEDATGREEEIFSEAQRAISTALQRYREHVQSHVSFFPEVSKLEYLSECEQIISEAMSVMQRKARDDIFRSYGK